MELSPEERHRIYLEEKVRLEAHQQPDAESKQTSAGAILGRIALGIIALLAVLWIIGTAMEQNEDTQFNALPPEQRHAETVKNCAELERGWAFKLYSELTPEERRIKLSCDQILSSAGGKP